MNKVEWPVIRVMGRICYQILLEGDESNSFFIKC